MIFFVDIDGTICTTVGGYENAKPIPENIAKINKLFDEGHTIIYWTARGKLTGLNWTELTARQLNIWGCRYHDVVMNSKPAYDRIIDDKAFKISEL